MSVCVCRCVAYSLQFGNSYSLATGDKNTSAFCILFSRCTVVGLLQGFAFIEICEGRNMEHIPQRLRTKVCLFDKKAVPLCVFSALGGEIQNSLP